MRILVIGGTRVVGRHIVAAALGRGHEVTLFNRGKTDPGGFPEATHLIGNRDTDRSALATGEWDATVDVCAFAARQVRSLLETLGRRAGHYTLISSLAVYQRDLPESGFTEADTDLLMPAWDDVPNMAIYGEQKVGCELVAEELVADELLTIRPGYVIGPYDHTERFTHWVRSVAAGKPFPAPAAQQPMQCIDGRDLAAFTLDCVEQEVVDAFTVTAPDAESAPTFAEMLATVARALDVELAEIQWADPTNASESLPFAAAPVFWPRFRASVAKAVDAGLRWRPLEDTVRDVAAYVGLRS